MSRISNPYCISWDNPAMSAHLSSANILEYFCDISNPFYDNECNNEVIKMQRLNPEKLVTMTGIEYYLDRAQEPILYIIRKQNRTSPEDVFPLAYYYVINGTVLQAPDLSRLCSSRLSTVSFNLNKSLKTLSEWANYHPADGSYSWVDPNETALSPQAKRTPAKSDNRQANLYQLNRIEYLLSDWTKQHPIPFAPTTPSIAPAVNPVSTTSVKSEPTVRPPHVSTASKHAPTATPSLSQAPIKKSK